MKKSAKLKSFAVVIASIGAIGGFLFGYNTAVISGALLVFNDLFHLSLAEKANVVSILILGALFGALIAGFLSDRLGRKKTVIVTAAVYVVGSFIIAATPSLGWLFIGRFITGLGVGLGSLIVPLYIAEMSPIRYRGMLVTMFQLMVTIGIFISYILNYYFDVAGVWRWLFVISLIFAGVLFVSMFFLPESPTWLIAHRKKAKARKILRLVRSGEDIDKIVDRVSKNSTKPKTKTTWKKSLISATIVGIGLSVAQQVTGINAVFYYAPMIFSEAGFASRSSEMLATIGLGAINVIATIFAMWFIDTKGRRPLLLIGTAGMFIGLLFLAICFFIGAKSISILSILSLMFYVVMFAIGLGPITWLLISEIFPMRVRGKVMSICVFANWFTNYLISLFFLPAVKFLGGAWTFMSFAILCALALYFIWLKVPETKGKSLEEIEKSWK